MATDVINSVYIVELHLVSDAVRLLFEVHVKLAFVVSVFPELRPVSVSATPP